MKTKSKITKRKKNPQNNTENRYKAITFIKKVAKLIAENSDRSSRHLSMLELKNIADIMDEIQNAFGLSGHRLPEYQDEDLKRRERELNYSANRGPV
jgi:hypothetical protein